MSGFVVQFLDEPVKPCPDCAERGVRQDCPYMCHVGGGWRTVKGETRGWSLSTATAYVQRMIPLQERGEERYRIVPVKSV